MNLENKNIFILSPCAWEGQKVSKHYYAEELSKKNTVYFLEWPFFSRVNQITENRIQGNLILLQIYLSIPRFFLFKFRFVFHFFLKKTIKNLDIEFDIIWSFDSTDRFSLRVFRDLFPKKIVVFHPVDYINKEAIFNNSKYADFTFSCSQMILECVSEKRKSHFINHGLSEAFLNPNKKVMDHEDKKIVVGISGSMIAPQIDFKTLTLIIDSNKNVSFNFFGNYQSNYDLFDEANSFIELVKSTKNCNLFGILDTPALAKELNNCDLFLFCYDMQKLNRGNNSHKLLEYLSTGKIIVSSFLELYKNNNGFKMTEKLDNSELPIIFKDVLGNIDEYNSFKMQAERLKFASSNTYMKQVLSIQNYIKNQ
jgi:hypothetical protein